MFLAFEIMEEASLRQSGGLADLVHRSGRVALGQHQLLGGVEQLLLGQRIALGYVHGPYLPVGMRISRVSYRVKPVFRELAAECCECRVRPDTSLANALVWPSLGRRGFDHSTAALSRSTALAARCGGAALSDSPVPELLTQRYRLTRLKYSVYSWPYCFLRKSSSRNT